MFVEFQERGLPHGHRRAGTSPQMELCGLIRASYFSSVSILRKLFKALKVIYLLPMKRSSASLEKLALKGGASE